MNTARSAWLAFLFTFGSCSQTTVDCSHSTLTYSSFGATFMSTYCLSCHSGTSAMEGVDLSSAALVAGRAASVEREAATGADMPPAGSTAPSAAERAKLAEWLSCGAP